MSSCHGSEEVRPGTARVLVTELSVSGHINPTPHDDSRTALELSYFSPEKLKLLCGTGDLSHVTSLEICVDTQENTLGNFGEYLPRLLQLRMNNSTIMSVRDLGTTLAHLQVLWMLRCSLQDLDGISTFSSLKELYVAYNSVSDLSQVGMLESLQLLDLEGNDVDDLVQIQYLGLCCKLRTLTLEGNPVCVRPNPTAIQTADYSYRAAVRELVPHLRYLDNLRVDEDGFSRSSTMGEDLDILRNSIRDCTSAETADGTCPFGRPASARDPSSSRSCIWPPSSAGSRPHTGSRPTSATMLGVLSKPGSRPGSAESDLATVETAEGACPFGRPASARHPSSSRSCIWPQSSAGSRPHTGSRPTSATMLGVLSKPGSRPGSAESDLATVETAEGACPFGRPVSARHPSSSRSCIWPQSSAGSRPHTGSRPTSATMLGVLSKPGSRPGSAESDQATVETETSILTHGAGKILFCGNPVKAIRARREKLRTAPTGSTFTPRDLPIHVPEHTYDLEEPDGRERADVFAELKAWREQHSSRLRAIETERLPQVLAIKHSDEEEGEDDDEEEGFGCLGTDSSDEESGEGKHVDCLDTASLDSAFQSLSPDLHHSEALSPDVARLTGSADTTLSPSPPPTGNRTQLGTIRARRFRRLQTNSECLPDLNRGVHSPGTATSVGDTDLTVQGVQQLTRTDVPWLPFPPSIPCPPPTNTLGKGLMDSWVQSGNKHLQLPPMSKLLARPAITRPHTAGAAVQKQKHHILQPSRGSSHPV